MAPVFSRVASIRLQRDLSVADFHSLCVFLSVMFTRTPSSFRELDAYVDHTAKEFLRSTGELTSVELSRIRASLDAPHLALLPVTPRVALEFFRLEPAVLRAPESHRFLTSDNPAVRYNQYLEQIVGLGTCGAGSPGLQIFLPLDPDHLLLLFDPEVYATSGLPNEAPLRVTPSDVAFLNLMQCVFADENLLGVSSDEAENLKSLVAHATPFRPARSVVHATFGEVGAEETSQLEVSHTATPNLSLSLTFLRILPSAARVPFPERPTLRRKLPDLSTLPPAAVKTLLLLTRSKTPLAT